MAKQLTSAQISANAANKTWTQANLWNLISALSAVNPKLVNSLGIIPPTPSPQQIVGGSPVYAPQAAAQNAALADTYTGLGVSFDPSGNPAFSGGQFFGGEQNFGIDQNGSAIGPTLPDGSPNPAYNPFSQAQMMKQAFTERKNATTNSYAARGQLYSGALQNAQNANQNNYDQSYDALNRNAKGYYGDLVSKAVSARDTGQINQAGITGNAVSDYTAAHANDTAPVIKRYTPAVKTPAPKVGRFSFGRLSNAFGR